MDGANATENKATFSLEESTERLWHLRRGFEAAFFISFLVLVFGIFFHETAYDLYLETFLGSRIADGGLGALRDASPGGALSAGWLWWAFAYGVSLAGGVWTVSLVATLLVTAAFGVALAFLKRHVSTVSAGLLLVAAAYVCRPYFVPAGQAMGIFLFSVLAVLLGASVESAGRRIWFAVPVMAVWANVDLTWTAGALLCLAFIPVMLRFGGAGCTEKALALAAAIVATLLNPDFAGAYGVFWRLPFGAATASGWVAPLGVEATSGTALVYVGSALAILLAFTARGALAAGFAAASALVVIAGVSAAVFPLLALCVAAAILEGLPGAVERAGPYIRGKAYGAVCDWLAAVLVRAGGETRSSVAPDACRLRRELGIQAALAGVGLVFVLALFSLAVAGSKPYTFGGGLDETKLPQGAVAFVKASGLKGIILVYPPWAGYLAKEDFPGARPFLDARPLATEGKAAAAVAWVFGMSANPVPDVSTIFKESNASAVLVPQRWARAVDFAPACVPVYWDDTAAVLVEDTPANKDLIAANDMRLTYPPYFGFGLTREKLPEVISALEKKVSLEEPAAYARYELGICYLLKGQRETAAAHLIIALGTDPTLAVAYHTLGDVVRLADKPDLIAYIAQSLSQDPGLTGMLDPVLAAKPDQRTLSLAIALYGQAIRYDPDFAMAYVRLGELLLQKGDVFRATSMLIDARKADERRPQLDKLAPGLRSELDVQIKKLTAPRPRQAGPAGASTEASLATPAAPSTDPTLSPATVAAPR